MATSSTTSFLDLAVGPYSLALHTRCVLSVLQDVPAAAALSFRDQQVPCLDLSYALAGRPHERLPFVIMLEAADRWAAIGVDDVDYLHPGEVSGLMRLPRFGLLRAELYEGALRGADRLLVV